MNTIHNKKYKPGNYFLMEKIDPLIFSKYLIDTGWKLFPRKRTDIKIFQYENNNNFFQVTIPIDKSLSDYYEAMLRAIETVAMKEKKSTEQIISYLHSSI